MDDDNDDPINALIAQVAGTLLSWIFEFIYIIYFAPYKVILW